MPILKLKIKIGISQAKYWLCKPPFNKITIGNINMNWWIVSLKYFFNKKIDKIIKTKEKGFVNSVNNHVICVELFDDKIM